MIAPTEIALSDGALHVCWPAEEVLLCASALRTACRCAACTARARRGEPVSAATDLSVVAVAPVGGYAVQLTFSDGHDRGIYPWPLLQALSTGGDRT